MKIIAVLTYLAFSQVLAAELVLKDEFVDPSGMDLQPDLNINVPERQSGTRPTTYSAEVPPTGEAQIGIESKAPLFEDDTSVLLMRTGPRVAEEGVFTALDLNEDFAPDLAGKKWKLQFTTRTARLDLSGDIWLAVSLGSRGAPDGPNSAHADLAILMRADGYLQIFHAGKVETATSPLVSEAVSFVLTVEVDETSTPALVTISAAPLGGVPVALMSEVPVNIPGPSRFLEFRSHVSKSPESTGFVDIRLGSLQIDAEP